MGYIYYKRNIWVDNVYFRHGMLTLAGLVALTVIITAIVHMTKKAQKMKQKANAVSNTYHEASHPVRYFSDPGQFITCSSI